MNNKQSSVEWLISQLTEVDYNCINKTFLQSNNSLAGYKMRELFEQAKAMHEEELNVAYGNGYEQGEMNFYKKMQVKGDKYAEGYSEGYKRALELVKWKIDNELQGGNNEQ